MPSWIVFFFPPRQHIHAQAESHFLEAKEWKSAVQMYMSRDLWDDAVRIAKTFGGLNASKQVAYAWAVSLVRTCKNSRTAWWPDGPYGKSIHFLECSSPVGFCRELNGYREEKRVRSFLQSLGWSNKQLTMLLRLALLRTLLNSHGHP